MTGQLAVRRPVGQILAKELEARDWTQADFAAVLQRPVQFVSEIVNGKKEITRESAAQIAAAFGNSPEFWLNQQNAYLLSVQAKKAETARDLDGVRRRARLNHLAPIAALRKRRIVTGRTLDELEREIMGLYDLESIEDDPSFVIAARRSNDEVPLTPTQTAWVGCVRKAAKARAGKVGVYSRDRLEHLAAGLPTLLFRPEEFERLPELLDSVGVCLVYVEALPGAKIDGCTFFLGSMPVIGLSGRGKRLDKVLFTLMHEIAHLTLGHVESEAPLIESIDDLDKNADEALADARAGTWVLPNGIPPLPSSLSRAWVSEQADRLGINFIVLVGRLQKEEWLPWRTPLAKDPPTVDAQLEGWTRSGPLS
ncbi:helix-turn-helix domain-containing protein [Amycolatopsis lexingtonensis]|uniref:helix-turn-helix domain-containing protein n=1 Tax=Amycolatopsis lexingtonensis TaxID=218822 RepID=UPI003F705664